MRRIACAAIAAAALAITPAAARAVPITVTSGGDSGPGTLRQAIADANITAAPDTIEFALPASTAIVLGTTALPPITQPLTIDGTTQPGTHRVELNGENETGNGLLVRASNSTVKGLDIHSFNLAAGILISNGASNVTISGNYIGTNFDGTVAKPNRTGVFVDASAGGQNVIGGPAPTDRNVISGNGVDGVLIAAMQQSVIGNYIGVEASGSGDLGNGEDGILFNSTGAQNVVGGQTPGERNVISGNDIGVGTFGAASGGNVIQGNYLGTDATGTVAVPNQTAGVSLVSADNAIGGSQPGAGNLISGNFYGVSLDGAGSTRNTVAGNLIGTQADGVHPLANFYGIAINPDANGNTIGVTLGTGANVIASNTGAGVVVNGASGNTVRANSIHDNGGLGIDLAQDGVTANDVNDADSGPNDLQNFPVIDSIAGAPGGTRVQGHLDTDPSAAGMYFIDLYSSVACDPSGNGEGEHWLGQAFVTADAFGHAAFDVTVPFPKVRFSQAAYSTGEGAGTATITVTRPDLGRFLTANATRTTGDSSEFGACVTSPNTASVHYATAADNATPGADYTETSGDLPFGATETSKTFSIPIANDQAVEDAERVTLSLSAPTGAALGSPASATLTINDDDVAQAPENTEPPGNGNTNPPPATTDRTAPEVTDAKIGTPFRIGSLLPLLLKRATAPTGTVVSFTLSEPARTTFAFKRKASGRRVRGRCVRPTRRNRRAKRCTRRLAAGSFSLPARQGANRVRFQGRFGTRRLKPGRYALSLRAVDAAGNRSAAVPLSFKLLPARRKR
jgi:hypothetical protein